METKATADLMEFEKLTAKYAATRAVLGETVARLTGQMDELRRAYRKELRTQVAAARDAKAAIKTAIDENRELFDRPRTRTMNGVKFGLQKARGTIVWQNEQTVIERIRKNLPEDQVELLIRRKENVHKPAVYDLSAGDLKRLGIEIDGAGDAVFISDEAAEVDKVVAALLAEGDEEVGDGQA